MFKIIVDDRMSLFQELSFVNHQFIVVEGYNGVGKSYVIKALSEHLHAPIYRPNYNGWAGEIPRELRWTIFQSIMDASSYMTLNPYDCMIFDRGVLSGAVYNEDITPLRYYSENAEAKEKVIHILVTVPDEETYYRLNKVRGSQKVLSYADYLSFTERYRQYLEDARIPYIEFINKYDYEYSVRAEGTCLGCSHYNLSDSKCKHPEINKKVSPSDCRCEHSSEREVQDGKELQPV